MRRTMLYLPGNNPNMLKKGHLFGSDGVIPRPSNAAFISRLADALRLNQGVGNIEGTSD